VLWAIVALLLLAAVAVLIPGSPVYLQNWLERGPSHDGHGIPYWVKALGSSNAQSRYQAIFALGAMGPDAGEAVPALAAVLAKDPDAEARHQAALALLKIGPPARAAVPELAEALDDEEPAVRMNVAILLHRLGPEARPAVPALIKALKREGNQTNLRAFHFTIQEMAALALGRASAGTAEGVPALTAFLEDAGTAERREYAARALGAVGSEARPAVPQLRPLLKDPSGVVREAAEEALQRIEGGQPRSGDEANKEK
jgi:HEAT repeat protein